MSTIKSSAENLTLNADGANNDIIFQSNGSTKATLDQAGLLTATTFSSSVSQNVSAIFNRTSNDGGVVSLRKNGSEVGNLGCRDGFLTIYSGDTGLGFADDHIRGMTSTGSRDAAIDLGRAATRFKDLYLSGGLKIGGTGATNTLDDYEEGVWTPTLTCSSSGSYTLDTGANLAAYTKIGRVVHVQASIGIASESSPNGNLRMSLPFTSFTGTKDTDNSMGNATLEGHGGTIVNGINIFVFGASYAQFPFIADNGTFDYLDHSHVDTAFSIKFSFSYIAT